MVDRPVTQRMVATEVAEAADRWARKIFGAPRKFSSLIFQVENKDELVHRVLTEVVRRDLREERAASQERAATLLRVDPSRLDPFAYSQESIRAETVHTVPCATCGASGRASCSTCKGLANVSCAACGGGGKIRNPKTNRLNKCKFCKGTGRTGCGTCGASGKVDCKTCNGSGHQRAWFTFVETRRVGVTILPQTPVALAHRQIAEPRMLSGSDVTAFTLSVDLRSPGPLTVTELDFDAGSAVQTALAGVDRRLERVTQQQYMQLRVERRDVSYRMCGTTGVLVLSGRSLAGAPTSDARRPIRRRLVIWPLFVLFVGFFSAAASSTVGRSAYFKDAIGAASLLWLAAVLLSVFWIGGVLRAWGSGQGLKGLRRGEWVCCALWVGALVSSALVGLVVRPTVEEVDQALANGDTHRARVVLDALRERSSDKFLDAEDAILMAEANVLKGEERLARLDQIAAHGRAQSDTAATVARAERLAEIRGLVADGRAAEAETAIDRWFSESWRGDPELAEERARAIDSKAEQCADDPCRLAVARAAEAAHGTPARAAAVERVRGKIVDTLVRREPEMELPAERLVSLAPVSVLAEQTLATVKEDEDLQALAVEARTWVADEHAKVAAIGADQATIQALFPPLHRRDERLLVALLEGTEVFFSFDAKGKCVALYAVGPAGRRALHSRAWPADKILSQAVGRPVQVKRPEAAGASSVTWKESGIKVVARWHSGELMELRIGEASP